MIYIFHRAEGFYPLTLRCDLEAISNALNNPGTTRVTDSENRMVYDPAIEQQPVLDAEIDAFVQCAKNFQRVGQYGETRLKSDIRSLLEAFTIKAAA